MQVLCIQEYDPSIHNVNPIDVVLEWRHGNEVWKVSPGPVRKVGSCDPVYRRTDKEGTSNFKINCRAHQHTASALLGLCCHACRCADAPAR